MITDKLKQFIESFDFDFPDEDIRKLTDEDVPFFEELVFKHHPDVPDLHIRQMLSRNAPYMTNMSYKTLYNLLVNKHSANQKVNEKMKIRLLGHPDAPISAVHEIANDDPSSYFGLASFDASVASPRILDELMKYPKLAILLAKQHSDSPLHAHIAKNLVNYPDFINHLGDEDVISRHDLPEMVNSFFRSAVHQGQLQQRDPQKIIVFAKLLNKIHNPNYRDLFSMGLENIGTLIHALATGNKETRQELESLNSKIQTQSRYSDDSQIQDIVNAYLLPDSNFNFDTLIDTFSDYSFLDKKQGKAVGQKMIRRGERVSGLLDISNHGLSFSDIVNKDDVLDTINNMKPKNWEHLEPLSESEKTILRPHIDVLLNQDRQLENRSVLTPFLEEEADPKFLYKHKKYQLKPDAFRQIADHFVPSYSESDKKDNPKMQFFFDQRVPNDVVDYALKRLRSEYKPHEFSGHSGIQMGPQVFARRSLTPGGYTGHSNVGVHPDRELRVKVGSAVLRKLRDHLEKAGQIRPEDLPKGELWNSITRPITDKSGNVNHVQDWNPLRAANGKLDPSKVQQYIDSMPEMKFIWSHDYWASPLQRHSNQPSAITMVNLHPDTIQTLRDKGLYQDFLDIQRSLPDIHPLGRDTIGWIRHTGSDDHVFDIDGKPNVFVDEVQSDLYNRLRSSSEPKHKQLMDIIFQGFHPSEILHESLHEQMRQQGSVGAPWATHTVASKSPMALDEAKEAPVHFKVSYEQVPKRMGAKPSTYGTLPTQSGDNPDHATQYALQGKPTWEDQIRKTEEPYTHTPSIVEHDYMNGQVKNLYAYKQHIKTNPQGAHVYLDGSHAKTLLTNHSHEKYFDAKNDMIGVLKRIVDEVCDFPCPIYHVGGMKFYVNTHGLKDALKIARAVDKVKDAMPGNEHYKPHFDIGVSENREEAHDAMERANAIKDHHTHPTQTYVVLGQDGHLQKLGMKRVEGLVKSEPLMKSTPAGIKHYEAILPTALQNAQRNAETHNEQDPELERYYHIMKTAPLVVNFPVSVVDQIAQSGRLKNLFETGTGMGSKDENRRAKQEYRTLGIPKDAPREERPIYGTVNIHDILRTKPNWKPKEGLGFQTIQRGAGTSSYGDAWFQLHPHVHDRTTVTPADTFAFDNDAHTVPFSHKHFVFDRGTDEQYDPEAPKNINNMKHYGYIEAQIHGGVDLGKDVHSIHVQISHPSYVLRVDPKQMKSKKGMEEYIKNEVMTNGNVKHLQRLANQYKVPLYVHWSDQNFKNYEHVIHSEDVGLTKSESTEGFVVPRTTDNMFHPKTSQEIKDIARGSLIHEDHGEPVFEGDNQATSFVVKDAPLFAKQSTSKQDPLSEFIVPELAHHMGLSDNFQSRSGLFKTTVKQTDPETGEELSPEERVMSISRMIPIQQYHQASFSETPENLQKLFLFDALTENRDRHAGNWGSDSNGRIQMIDHGRTFGAEEPKKFIPSFLEGEMGWNTSLEPSVRQWICNFDPNEIEKFIHGFRHNEFPDGMGGLQYIARTAKERLSKIQQIAKDKPSATLRDFNF
jgi:hypothetical protein